MNLAALKTAVSIAESENGLFPPPLRGLLGRSGWPVLLLTLRHGRHLLLQLPHLLPVLPPNVPVGTQGLAGRERQREREKAAG